MSEPVLRDEFDRLLNVIERSEARITQRLDDGFGLMNNIKARVDVMESRLALVERVLFAAIGLALATLALALINSVVRS